MTESRNGIFQTLLADDVESILRAMDREALIRWADQFQTILYTDIDSLRITEARLSPFGNPINLQTKKKSAQRTIGLEASSLPPQPPSSSFESAGGTDRDVLEELRTKKKHIALSMSSAAPSLASIPEGEVALQSAQKNLLSTTVPKSIVVTPHQMRCASNVLSALRYLISERLIPMLTFVHLIYSLAAMEEIISATSPLPEDTHIFPHYNTTVYFLSHLIDTEPIWVASLGTALLQRLSNNQLLRTSYRNSHLAITNLLQHNEPDAPSFGSDAWSMFGLVDSDYNARDDEEKRKDLKTKDARLIYTERENCFDAFKSLLHRCQGHWTDSSAGTVEKVLTELKKSFVPSAKSSKIGNPTASYHAAAVAVASANSAPAFIPTYRANWAWFTHMYVEKYLDCALHTLSATSSMMGKRSAAYSSSTASSDLNTLREFFVHMVILAGQRSLWQMILEAIMQKVTELASLSTDSLGNGSVPGSSVSSSTTSMSTGASISTANVVGLKSAHVPSSSGISSISPQLWRLRLVPTVQSSGSHGYVSERGVGMTAEEYCCRVFCLQQLGRLVRLLCSDLCLSAMSTMDTGNNSHDTSQDQNRSVSHMDTTTVRLEVQCLLPLVPLVHRAIESEQLSLLLPWLAEFMDVERLKHVHSPSLKSSLSTSSHVSTASTTNTATNATKSLEILLSLDQRIVLFLTLQPIATRLVEELQQLSSAHAPSTAAAGDIEDSGLQGSETKSALATNRTYVIVLIQEILSALSATLPSYLLTLSKHHHNAYNHSTARHTSTYLREDVIDAQSWALSEVFLHRYGLLSALQMSNLPSPVKRMASSSLTGSSVVTNTNAAAPISTASSIIISTTSSFDAPSRSAFSQLSQSSSSSLSSAASTAIPNTIHVLTTTSTGSRTSKSTTAVGTASAGTSKKVKVRTTTAKSSGANVGSSGSSMAAGLWSEDASVASSTPSVVKGLSAAHRDRARSKDSLFSHHSTSNTNTNNTNMMLTSVATRTNTSTIQLLGSSTSSTSYAAPNGYPQQHSMTSPSTGTMTNAPPGLSQQHSPLQPTQSQSQSQRMRSPSLSTNHSNHQSNHSNNTGSNNLAYANTNSSNHPMMMTNFLPVLPVLTRQVSTSSASGAAGAGGGGSMTPSSPFGRGSTNNNLSNRSTPVSNNPHASSSRSVQQTSHHQSSSQHSVLMAMHQLAEAFWERQRSLKVVHDFVLMNFYDSVLAHIRQIVEQGVRDFSSQAEEEVYQVEYARYARELALNNAVSSAHDVGDKTTEQSSEPKLSFNANSTNINLSSSATTTIAPSNTLANAATISKRPSEEALHLQYTSLLHLLVDRQAQALLESGSKQLMSMQRRVLRQLNAFFGLHPLSVRVLKMAVYLTQEDLQRWCDRLIVHLGEYSQRKLRESLLYLASHYATKTLTLWRFNNTNSSSSNGSGNETASTSASISSTAANTMDFRAAMLSKSRNDLTSCTSGSTSVDNGVSGGGGADPKEDTIGRPFLTRKHCQERLQSLLQRLVDYDIVCIQPLPATSTHVHANRTTSMTHSTCIDGTVYYLVTIQIDGRPLRSPTTTTPSNASSTTSSSLVLQQRCALVLEILQQVLLAVNQYLSSSSVASVAVSTSSTSPLSPIEVLLYHILQQPAEGLLMGLVDGIFSALCPWIAPSASYVSIGRPPCVHPNARSMITDGVVAVARTRTVSGEGSGGHGRGHSDSFPYDTDDGTNPLLLHTHGDEANADRTRKDHDAQHEDLSLRTKLQGALWSSLVTFTPLLLLLDESPDPTANKSMHQDPPGPVPSVVFNHHGDRTASLSSTEPHETIRTTEGASSAGQRLLLSLVHAEVVSREVLQRTLQVLAREKVGCYHEYCHSIVDARRRLRVQVQQLESHVQHQPKEQQPKGDSSAEQSSNIDR